MDIYYIYSVDVYLITNYSVGMQLIANYINVLKKLTALEKTDTNITIGMYL